MINRRHFLEGVFVVAVCAVFGFLVLCFARSSSATYDEITDLPAGYTYLRWNDYRLNPEHPPLIKKLAALPLLFRAVWPAKEELLAADDSGNRALPIESATELRRAWAGSVANIDEQWNFGHFFLYGVRAETLRRLHEEDARVKNSYSVPGTAPLRKEDFYNDAAAMLFRGRIVIMGLGISLALLVYFWAREIFGIAGAGFSLLLCVCDPNLIAHSGLVTNDVAVALFMFGAVYFFYRLSRCIQLTSLIFFTVFFGLALVTKFSAVLLVPLFLLGLSWRIVSRNEWAVDAREKIRLTTLRSRAIASLLLFVITLVVALVIIWAAYGFRYSAMKSPAGAALDRPSDHFPLASELYIDAALTAELKAWPNGVPPEKGEEFDTNLQRRIAAHPLKLSGRLVLFANNHRLLPEAYLYGFGHILRKSHARGAFLRGQYSDLGFRSYYLWTFLLKTPLPILLVIAGSLVSLLVRRTFDPWMIFIAAPVVLYAFFAMLAHVNIGHRYLLPIYPFLYVLCGLLTQTWRKFSIRLRWSTAMVAVFFLIFSSQFVFSSGQIVRVHPNYLAYFNELAGGPGNGHKSLVDSNLDWGQDLNALHAWLDRHKIVEPIWLSYFGTADPRFYQVSHRNVPKLLGGYALESSAYDELEEAGRDQEAVNRFVGDLRAGQYIAISATNFSGAYLGRDVHDMWERIFDHCTYVDQIGYSILIYRVGPAR